MAQLIQRRGGRFNIDINGEDPLQLEMEDITLEGANTSFQVHYRVNPEDYADSFNAIQLMTPLALALAANSPTLFGHSLWHETRIPLFKQSIDTRQVDRYSWNEPARVSFGQGWARRGARELFREVVRIYPPLLPICAPQSPAQEIAAGRTPSLAELRLHQSTVWLWNRPIYDDADGGMLRIEMRALPAGPTAVDMVANAAFLIGLAEGIRPQLSELLPALPFAMAEYNFYRAAQYGLDARLVWPELGQSGYREQSILRLSRRCCQWPREGLAHLGISSDESARYLRVIETRLARRQTGCSLAAKRLAQLKQEMPLQAASASIAGGIYCPQCRQPACGGVAPMRRFQFIRDPLATDIGNNVEEFLRCWAGRPASFSAAMTTADAAPWLPCCTVMSPPAPWPCIAG